MRLLLALLTVIVLSLGVAACGADDKEAADDEATATATATPSAAEEQGCKKVDAPEPKGPGKESKPTARLSASKTYTAVVQTSCGEFSIKLDVKRAPKTGASFVHLAKKGFFDGTTFHRIVPGFVIQGGDPEGQGTGGPGYSVTEKPPSDLQYTRGIVAMAKTQAEAPGTSGSQFYVVTGEDAGLPPEYALLGKVSAGDDIVDRIATVPTDPQTEQPIDPVVIEKVTIEEK
jgi:cyclophilin family peptidyl-prolyl cis-trans isomerase